MASCSSRMFFCMPQPSLFVAHHRFWWLSSHPMLAATYICSFCNRIQAIPPGCGYPAIMHSSTPIVAIQPSFEARFLSGCGYPAIMLLFPLWLSNHQPHMAVALPFWSPAVSFSQSLRFQSFEELSLGSFQVSQGFVSYLEKLGSFAADAFAFRHLVQLLTRPLAVLGCF